MTTPPVLDRALDEIYEGVIKSGGKAVRGWARSLDIFRTARRRYADSLLQHCATVRILGMAKPLQLRTLYVRVRAIVGVRSRKYLDEQYMEYVNNRQELPDAIRKELDRIVQDNAVDALDLVADNNRLILVGGPGTGKTTFLRFVATRCLEAQPDRPSPFAKPLLPILLTLRSVVDEKLSIRQLAYKEFSDVGIPEPRGIVRRLLASGNALLLLDGFDEVSSARQTDVVKQIRNLAREFPRSRIVLTSRISESLAPLEMFTEVQLAEFGPSEAEELVRNWFSDEKPATAKRLIRRIRQDIHLRELATTPLLVSLLCILYKFDLRIPHNRAELYRRCVECLLREWDSSRGFRRETEFERMSDTRKLQMLAEIAWGFFKRDRLFFRKQVLIEEIAKFVERLGIGREHAASVLRELESHHGLIGKKAAGWYGFSHLTFQEYFTAQHLVSRHDLGALRNEVREQKWREVIVLAAASLVDASELIDHMINSIDRKKMEIMARRGSLGYEFQLVRDLVFAELTLSASARRRLYSVFFGQLMRVYPIPWAALVLRWKYSKKGAMTTIDVGLARGAKKGMRVTHVIRGVQELLESLVRSGPMLRHFQKNHVPRIPESRRGFAQFVELVEATASRGGAFTLRFK